MPVRLLKNYNNKAIVLGAFITALLCSGCSTSGSGNDTVNNRECRNIENLGSRIQRPTCLSKEQWAVIDKKNKETLDENGRQTQAVLRQALQKGSMAEGRAFDNPAMGPY